MRFTSRVLNVGAGPFEIYGSRPDTSTPVSVVQRIYDNAGGYRDVPVGPTMIYAGDGHNHSQLANVPARHFRD